MAVMKPGWARSTEVGRPLVKIPEKITATWLRREMGMCQNACAKVRRMFPKGVSFTAQGLRDAVGLISDPNATPQPEQMDLHYFFRQLLPARYTYNRGFGYDRAAHLRVWLSHSFLTPEWGHNRIYRDRITLLLLVCFYHKLL